MQTNLCHICGQSSVPRQGLSCASCCSTPGGTGHNYMCTYCGCPEVEFFCICKSSPVWLCKRHKVEHEMRDPPHWVCKIEACYGLERNGIEAFKQNFLAAVSSCDQISDVQQLIAAEQQSFEFEKDEILKKVALLEQYSRGLQGKWLRLEQLKNSLTQDHPLKPTQNIISEALGTSGRDLTELLSRFTGQFTMFDREAALTALELRPKMKLGRASCMNLGLDRLNFAVSLLQHPINPVSSEARMCFLDDDRLLVCGGPRSKAAFFVNTSMQRTPIESMKTERESHGVVQFRKSVYVFGGTVESSRSVHTWECLSLDTNTWEAGPMKQGRQFFNPGVFKDKIYLAGGHADYRIETFDPVTHIFEQMKSSPKWALGGIVLELKNELLILFDKKVYRPMREPKAIDQTFDLLDIGMFSIVSPIYDENGVVHLLLSDQRKLRVTVNRDLLPDITSYPS